MPTGTFVFSSQLARSQMVDTRSGVLASGPNALWYFNFQNLASQLANLQAVANNAFGTNVFTLADQPSLALSDAGYVGFVSDYGHLVYWNGTAWIFLDGVGGYFVPFALTPGTGWAACDGSSVKILQVGATLTTTSITTPNLNGSAAYIKSAASYSSTINAASGSTDTGSTGTGTTGTGTTGTGTSGKGTPHHHTIGSTSVNVLSTASPTIPNHLALTDDESDHTHSIPGLSIPGLSVPALSIPHLGVGTIDMAHVGAPFYIRQ